MEAINLSWPMQIRRRIYGIVFIVLLLSLTSGGFIQWSEFEVHKMLERAHGYHTTSNGYYLNALNELGQMQNDINVNLLANYQAPQIENGFLARYSPAVSLHLVNQYIDNSNVLHQKFADKQFDLLKERVKQQLGRFEEMSQKHFHNSRIIHDENFLQHIDTLMTILKQLVRLHTVARDDILIEIELINERLWLYLFMLLAFFSVIMFYMVYRATISINQIVAANEGAFKTVIDELEYTKLHLEEMVSEKTQDLLVALKLAESANEEKSRFLANMSHELRTPMHAILGFSEMGYKRALKEDYAKTVKHFKLIGESGLRLTNLLDNLLNLSKLEAGKTDTNFTEYSVIELIKAVVADIAPLCEKNNLEILEHHSDAQLQAEFDPELMRQVITNLLSNAIKFSPYDGHITIQSEVISAELDNHMQNVLHISVKDQGVGIPQDELLDVFDKFIQSSNNTSVAGGTGLGLSICKEIMALHKGRIWAESANADEEVQAGVIFHVITPLTQSLNG